MRQIITVLGTLGGLSRVAAAPLALADLAWLLAGRAWAAAILVLTAAWLTTRLPMIAGAAAASAKAYAVESRLNALIPKIPSPQPAPAGHNDTTSSPGNSSYGASNSSYGASNSSYSMGGGTSIAYDPGNSNNNGGVSSQTSGQIGGASAHVHSMTHYHTSSGDLQNVFNALYGSHSALVPTVTALRQSHSDLVPAVNALRDSHSSLVVSVQDLKASHSDLSNRHNTLLATLQTSRLLT